MSGGASALPAAAVAVGLISQNLGAALAKNLFPIVGVEGAVAMRIAFSAILLVVLLRPWRGPSIRDVWPDLLLYGAALGVMNLCIYQAFKLIPIGVAVAIEVLGPLAVVLAATRRLVDHVWTLLAAAGLYLLLRDAWSGAALDPRGVAFALAAAGCWALYIVFGKRVSGRLSGGRAVAIGMIVATMLTAPLAVPRVDAAMFLPATLALGVAVAVLSSALPYLLEMFALRRLPSRVFGLLVSSAPAVAAVAGFLVLRETLSVTQWLAVGCVAIASAGAATWVRRDQPGTAVEGGPDA